PHLGGVELNALLEAHGGGGRCFVFRLRRGGCRTTPAPPPHLCGKRGRDPQHPGGAPTPLPTRLSPTPPPTPSSIPNHARASTATGGLKAWASWARRGPCAAAARQASREPARRNRCAPRASFGAPLTTCAGSG